MALNIGPGDVVLDCGSEEGDLSALIASWIGPRDGGIVLFEPNPRVFSNIKYIWDANDLKQPLAFFPGFAGDFNRHLDTVHMERWPDSAYGPVISDHGFCQLNERPDIPAIRIDDLVGMSGVLPTVLNLDVEGSEGSVLDGAIDTLRELKPLVYASLHPEFMREQYNRDVQEIHDYMGHLGYRVKHLATDHEQHYVWHHPFGRELRY